MLSSVFALAYRTVNTIRALKNGAGCIVEQASLQQQLENSIGGI